jgi:hypothetical protein
VDGVAVAAEALADGGEVEEGEHVRARGVRGGAMWRRRAAR